MHIGILSTQLGTPGGPATVDRRMLRHMAELDKENQYSIYALTEPARTAINFENSNFKIKPIKPSGKWLGLSCGVAMEMKRNPIDLLHATFVPPPYVPGRFVMAMTCWSQYSEPELYPPLVRWRLVYLLNHGIKRSSAIFCYTEFLKEKIIEKFNYDPDRIFIASPGVGSEMKPMTDRDALDAYLKQLGIEGPYILFIGALTKRKNVTRLIEAYARLVKESKIEQKLVLVGERLFSNSSEIYETIDRLDIEDRIIFVGQRPHEDLPWLYNGADVFVFPTLSEGFGMTPLEAMACGTPVVASNVTSVPEVVGEGAIKIDPTSTDEMAAGILKCLTDDKVRADLIQKGLANATRYDWNASASHMISTYQTIIDEGW